MQVATAVERGQPITKQSFMKLVQLYLDCRACPVVSSDDECISSDDETNCPNSGQRLIANDYNAGR